MKFQPTKGIYLQIADNICEKVLSDTFPPGSKIPSVRELALATGVNPNTIVRAYSELQAQDIIENRRGIGFFVNPDAKQIIHKRKRDEFFNQILPEIIRQAHLLGISTKELTEYMSKTGQLPKST